MVQLQITTKGNYCYWNINLVIDISGVTINENDKSLCLGMGTIPS